MRDPSRKSHLHLRVKSCKGKYFAQEEQKAPPERPDPALGAMYTHKLSPLRDNSRGLPSEIPHPSAASRNPPGYSNHRAPVARGAELLPQSTTRRNWPAKFSLGSIEVECHRRLTCADLARSC